MSTAIVNNKNWHKTVKWTGIALGAIIALVIAGAALLAISVRQFQATGKIATNVSIAGIDASGLNASEALAKLETQLLPRLPTEVDLTYPNGVYTISREELGAAVVPAEAVCEAMQIGREGSWWEQIQTRLRLWRRGYDIPLRVWIDQHRLQQALKEIAAQIDCGPVDAQVRVTDDGQVEKVPGKVGITLQIDESQTLLQQALSDPWRRSVELAVLAQPPNISTEDLQNIEVVLSSYSTPFNPARVDRTHNLRLAIARVNNTVLLPGEEFSLNKTVGPRLAEAGYRAAPIFRENEVVPETGGGVCQVATTVYNAALLANMEMIERHHHSRPVVYCPPGRDATVYYGQLDMRFKNSLSHPVLILGGVEKNRLWVKFLGKAEDDYDVKLIRAGLRRSGYATKEVPDPELEEGQREVETEGRSGLSVTLIREVWSKEGELIARQTMHSDVYPAQTEIVRVGTKQTGAELAPAGESSATEPPLPPLRPE